LAVTEPHGHGMVQVLFEVLISLTMNITVFWDVTPCTLVARY